MREGCGSCTQGGVGGKGGWKVVFKITLIQEISCNFITWLCTEIMVCIRFSCYSVLLSINKNMFKVKIIYYKSYIYLEWVGKNWTQNEIAIYNILFFLDINDSRNDRNCHFNCQKMKNCSRKQSTTSKA